MKSKTIFGLFAFALVTLGLAAFASKPAQADNHRVTICHATDSHKNPYTKNTVSKSSVDEPNNKYLNGHGDHKGDVWYPGIADHSWGDIIPPFSYTKKNGQTINFKGYNWTDAGKAWYNNNCNEPESTTVNYCDTTQVTGSVESWLKRNGMNGADCFDYAVEQGCGFLDVTITDQPQPQYSQGPFHAVYTLNGQVAASYMNFPAEFPEDYNGGSVEVTWFTVGPESDWLKDSATFPNLWNEVGQKITVDTDCEEEVTEANITAKVACVASNGAARVQLTLTNDGDADGDVMVNGETVSVPVSGPIVLSYASGAELTVVIDGETVIDRKFTCGGQGSSVPDVETPGTPETPKTPQVAELPYTGASVTPLVAAGVLSLAGIILVAGSAIKSRLLA